jgi:D-xylose 1-dehydrogenase (NADP+, D-xylono-1,5-lactone-forming)
MKLKWGLIGCSKVAVQHMLPAMAATCDSSIHAIASHSPERRRYVSQKYNISLCYDSYVKLIQDPDIDSVYISLPNSYHHIWAEQALDAGKSVLIEKPAVLDLSTAHQLVELARSRNRLILEGFMYRFHPQWSLLLDRFAPSSEEPAIFRAHFGFHLDDRARPDDFRLARRLGGGAFFDVGCYAVSAAGMLFGEATFGSVVQFRRPDEEIDRVSAGTLVFANGQVATFDCDFQFPQLSDSAELRSRAGTFILDPAFHYSPSATMVRILRAGGPDENVEVAPVSPFEEMIKAFNNWAPSGAESVFAKEQAKDLLRNAWNMAKLAGNRHTFGLDKG